MVNSGVLEAKTDSPGLTHNRDLEMIATRLTPFAPRSTTRSTILSIETYKERLQILEALLDNKKLTCPVCRSSKHVIIVGSRKKRGKKI
jgi:hypothetical protein